MSFVLAGGADTIVARATAPGRGALAVVRLSGSECARVLATLGVDGDHLESWRARLVDLRGDDGEPLERAVVTWYRAPRSYTGEDMAELVVHGSPYLTATLVAACQRAGARLAEPGEFTRRAVANGKMDLVQAEAVRDLIAAETALQAKTARAQLAGELSGRVRDLRDRLVSLLAVIEGNLDFADLEVTVSEEPVAALRASCREALVALLASAAAGRLLRDGARVVVLGRPNAGKSTLFNRLVGSARAIVAAEPGTTRDVVEAELDVAGLEVVLADTAGIRTADGAVEGEGVRRALDAAAEAAVILLLAAVDSGDQPPEPPAGPVVVRVATKADLVAASGCAVPPGWLAVSALTGDGVETLRQALAAAVVGEVADLGGEVAIAARHETALREAEALLAEDEGELEVVAQRVRWALAAVRRVIGEVDDEAVLDEVFATFCLGK